MFQFIYVYAVFSAISEAECKYLLIILPIFVSINKVFHKQERLQTLILSNNAYFE